MGAREEWREAERSGSGRGHLEVPGVKETGGLERKPGPAISVGGGTTGSHEEVPARRDLVDTESGQLGEIYQ